MGLCKCARKKVTNLFCFDHKVNVCEHCLVENHDKCIVKSYLQWLADSDYNPICTICNRNLQTDNEECIRLICYDIFHLNCLDEIARKLPENTAPAGYECPDCNKSIIPQSNQIGPLVDCLKSKLSKSVWFQRSIGAKLSDEIDADNFEFVEPVPIDPDMKSTEERSVKCVMVADRQTNEARATNTTQSSLTVSHSRVVESHSTDHTVYQMPDLDDPSANIRKSAAGNRPTQATFVNLSDKQAALEDDNKYSRRPLLGHISTLIKAHFPYSTSRRSPQKAYYYFMLSLLLGLAVFVMVLWFFAILGRYSADNDPMLDPRFNPNLNFGKIDNAEPDSVDIIRGNNNLQRPRVRV